MATLEPLQLSALPCHRGRRPVRRPARGTLDARNVVASDRLCVRAPAPEVVAERRQVGKVLHGVQMVSTRWPDIVRLVRPGPRARISAKCKTRLRWLQ